MRYRDYFPFWPFSLQLLRSNHVEYRLSTYSNTSNKKLHSKLCSSDFSSKSRITVGNFYGQTVIGDKK